MKRPGPPSLMPVHVVVPDDRTGATARPRLEDQQLWDSTPRAARLLGAPGHWAPVPGSGRIDPLRTGQVNGWDWLGLAHLGAESLGNAGSFSKAPSCDRRAW